VGIKKQELINVRGHFILNPTISSHLFVKLHRISSNILNIAGLDGVLEVDAAERTRARLLALDRVGAGGAVVYVLIVVRAGAFAHLVELGVHVAGRVCCFTLASCSRQLIEQEWTYCSEPKA